MKEATMFEIKFILCLITCVIFAVIVLPIILISPKDYWHLVTSKQIK